MAGTATLSIIVHAKDEASKTLKQVEGSAGGLGSKLGLLATAAVGAVAAIASFKTIESAISSTQDLGLAVSKMSRETGLATEESSRLIFAFKHFGLTTDDASRSLGILAKKLKGVQDEETGVSTGGKTTADILADIGVKATDAEGKLRPLGELIPQIADRFKAMPDGIEKTGLAMQLFGRSGKDMIPVLNQGSEGLKELGAEADKLGVTLSAANVQKIKDYTFAHRDMEEAIAGIKLQIGLYLMPKLTELAKWFTEQQPRMREFVDKALVKVEEGFVALGKWLQDNRQTFLDVAAGIAAMGKAMFEFGSWVISNKALLIAALIGIGAALISFTGPVGIIAGILSIAAGLGLIESAAKGAKDEVSDLVGVAAGFDDTKITAFMRKILSAKEFAEFQAKAQAQLVGKIAPTGVREAARMAEEDFGMIQRGAREAAKATAELNTETDGLGDGLGGGGGTTEKITAEQQALLDLMNALAAVNMTGEQFVQWQIECQNAAAFLTQAAEALGMTFESLVDAFLRSGLAASEFGERISALTALKDLQTQAEDAMGAVNGLYDAFNRLYAAPTKEGAQQNLALAQLREQRATLIAGGAEADSKKVKKIDEEIASIQADIDVRRAHQEVDRAWMDVKNATLLLDKDQAAMTQALIGQMGPLSTTAADFNTQLFIATWGMQDLIAWFGKLTGSTSAAQRAIERYAKSTEGEKVALAGATPEQLAILWQGGKAPSFQLGGIMPYTGMAHLEAGERVIPAGRQLTVGESKRTQNFYAPITVQVSSNGASLEDELARLLR